MVTVSNTRSGQSPGRVSTTTRQSGLRADRVRRARLDRLTPPTQAATLIVRIGTPRHRGQLSATDHQRAAPDTIRYQRAAPDAIRYQVPPVAADDPPGRSDLIDVPAGTGGDGSPRGSIHPAAETLPDRPPPVATSPQTLTLPEVANPAATTPRPPETRFPGA
jgi:hypothetical protein